MNPTDELQGFTTDRPVVVALVACDSIATAFGTGKLVLSGLFDSVYLVASPLVISGAVLATLAGVLEPVDCRFEIVAYPNDQPLGVRQLIGRVHVQVPPNGTVATVFVAGALVFPTREPGRCDIRLYGNGELLLSRPIYVNPPPSQQPPAPQPPADP